MRELTFIESGRLEWRQVAEPTLGGEAEALVRPIAASNCDVDTAIVRGDVPLPGPFAIGHEFVAEVVEVGAAVSAVRVGEQVIVPWKVSCGECEQCRCGLVANCTGVAELAMYGLPFGGGWGAGLSDLVRVPYADHMLLAVPEGLSPATIVSASDNMPDAWRCVASQLQKSPGADVLIIGGGTRSTGLFAAGFAEVLGAGRVDYVDRDPGRLEIAAAYGANPIESDPATQRLGPYPITVDASSRAAGLGLALRSTEPGGTCTSTGIYWGDTPLPLFEMYKAGITFQTGLCHARTLLPELLDFLSTGRFRPELAVAETVAWDDAPEAYARLTTKTVVLR